MKTFRLIAAALCCLLAAAGIAHAAKEKKPTLRIFCWSEYIPEEVLKKFTKETGIKVSVENYASNEEMMSKLLAGATKYDIIQPSEYGVEQLIKHGRLEEIDWSRVPNVKNLDPSFKGRGHDPELKYSVPWMAGSVGIVVNTAKVKDEIRGYKDVFQPKYKGRIVVVDDARELVSWAMATIGKKPNEITPEVLEQVRPILKEWIPLIKLFDSDSPKAALLNGDVDLGIVWSGEAALLYSEDKKFKYVLPAEGAHQFIDNLAIPKGSANKAAAEDFINFILRPEISRIISKEFPYTNPNAEARKLLTKEELANPASYPPGNPELDIFRDVGPVAQQIDKLVTDLKAAE